MGILGESRHFPAEKTPNAHDRLLQETVQSSCNLCRSSEKSIEFIVTPNDGTRMPIIFRYYWWHGSSMGRLWDIMGMGPIIGGPYKRCKFHQKSPLFVL